MPIHRRLTTSHYPSDDELEAWVRASCLPAFQDYVGLDYDDSAWDVSTISPDQSAWSSSNTVECLVEKSDKTPWTGTAQGTRV